MVNFFRINILLLLKLLFHLQTKKVHYNIILKIRIQMRKKEQGESANLNNLQTFYILLRLFQPRAYNVIFFNVL